MTKLQSETFTKALSNRIRPTIEQCIDDVLTRGYCYEMIMSYPASDVKKFYGATKHLLCESEGEIFSTGVLNVPNVLNEINTNNNK